MRASAEPHIACFRARLRGIWPDANPLRRTCDRVEVWILFTLLAIFLVGTPLIAIIAGGYAYGAGIHAERTSHRVTTILLGTVRASGNGAAIGTAPARWIGPGDRSRFGRVHAPAEARAGSAVTAWVDRSGRLVSAPPRRADLVRESAVAALIALAAFASLLLSAGAIAHWVSERWRMAAWATEWQSTEPKWARPSEL